MAGWWSKAVSAVGDKIGLDEDSQAAITSAGTNLGTKVGGIVTQVQEHAAEMSADSQRWQEEADARRAAEARKQEAARLPWEVDAADEAKSILSQDLMERWRHAWLTLKHQVATERQTPLDTLMPQ